MRYSDIAKTTATLSTEMSRRVFAEILEGKWRCYGTTSGTMDEWVERYLVAHARVPGIITETMPSSVPVMVIRWWRQNPPPGMAEGVVYQNGAVITIYVQGQAGLKLLFVAEQDAIAWHYPEQGYLVFSQLMDAQRMEGVTNDI